MMDRFWVCLLPVLFVGKITAVCLLLAGEFLDKEGIEMENQMVGQKENSQGLKTVKV